MSEKDKQLVGAAGEYLVLSRLLTRGYLAAQADGIALWAFEIETER